MIFLPSLVLKTVFRASLGKILNTVSTCIIRIEGYRLSEKKTTEAFYVTEKLQKEIHAVIGFSEKSEKSKSECYVDFFKKLILNKSSPAPNSPIGEQVKSDVPLTQPSLSERAKNDPALKEFLENINRPLPPPPCNYVAKGGIDPKTQLQYVFCDNPKRSKGKPLQIALTVCQKCWERKEWVKKHKPKNIKQIYCNQDGLWVFPTKCVNCKTPCDKAPASNPYLTDLERYKREQGGQPS